MHDIKDFTIRMLARTWLSLLLVCAAAMPASAHFLWVVPQPDGKSAHIIVSESLSADTRVDIGIVAGAKLSLRDEAGREAPLTLTRAGYVLTTPLAGPGVVHGHADLGIRPSGQRTYRLHYYPKTIVGDAFATPIVVSDAPIEIVPIGKPGAIRFKVLVEGKPAAGVDVNVLLPDGSDTTAQTGSDGVTEVLTAQGRYAAWARLITPVSGTHDGKAFDQTRHYTMLVVDAGTAPATGSSTAVREATPAGTLPHAASSFGAAIDDGWLYVFGGHVVPTHSYSVEAVSGRFERRKASGTGEWESLPSGPASQGMNLAAHGGKVYRVGGMQPRNRAGEPSDTWSIADVARFTPGTSAWEALPSLPTPRSSHDVVVVGDSLVVVGGWTMRGKDEPTWPETMEILDLKAPTLAWRSVPQPFKRRALVAAAHGGKVYVIGGFDDDESIVRGMSVYDFGSQSWAEGPALPGGKRNGFGPAATIVEGRLYVSIDDGGLYRLNDTATGWDKVAQATPRIVHRLVTDETRVLVVGGAARGDNSDLIEVVDVKR